MLPRLVYEVTFREAALEVELSWEGTRPGASWSFDRGGRAEELELAEGSGWRKRALDAAGASLPAAGRLRYRHPLDTGGGTRGGTGSAGAYVLTSTAYLLRPARLADAARVALRMRGGDPLLPWEADATGWYRVRGRDLRDPGFHTFGGRRSRLKVPGGEVQLAILPGAAASDAELEAWIAQGLRELLTVHPRLPHRRVLITLIPSWGREASPFGQVLWSTPPSLALYVGSQAGPAAFARDWVAVHELAHLAHPRLLPRQAWLTEGIATYYQTVARIRSGRLSRERAWGTLRRGVAAGRRETRERELPELARRMHSWHCYRAVYWGGALFALDLDLSLRAASTGRESLDTVLGRLLARSPRTRLEAFAAEVDRAAGRGLYAELAARHLTGPAFEHAEALLQRAGCQAGAQASPELAAIEAARAH